MASHDAPSVSVSKANLEGSGIVLEARRMMKSPRPRFVENPIPGTPEPHTELGIFHVGEKVLGKGSDFSNRPG